MSDGRSAILGRLSARLAHAAAADAPEIMQRVNQHARGPQPQWTESARARFLAKLEKVVGTWAELAAPEHIVQAAADYLAAQKLPQRLVLAPHPLLDGLVWPVGWQAESRRAQGEDRASLAVAFCGIAETGSLLLLAGPESPTTLNFLPDDILSVLPQSRIVQRMEDAWALLRAPPIANVFVPM